MQRRGHRTGSELILLDVVADAVNPRMLQVIRRPGSAAVAHRSSGIGEGDPGGLQKFGRAGVGVLEAGGPARASRRGREIRRYGRRRRRRRGHQVIRG